MKDGPLAALIIAGALTAVWTGPALIESTPTACGALTQRMLVDALDGQKPTPQQAIMLGLARALGPGIEAATAKEPWPVPSMRCAAQYWKFVTVGPPSDG